MSKSNRGNPTQPMSLISAALSLHQWMVEHQRAPLAHECCPANGLHHHRTYYRIFGLSNFSAGILPMVSALCSSVKMRGCLGYTADGADCPHRFPDEGCHIRLCHQCRKKGNDESPTECHIPVQIQRLTLRELTSGGGGWDIWQPWVEQVDWHGGDEAKVKG